MENERILKELVFCLGLWEKQGFCEFGNMTKCEECGTPYLLWKLLTGEVIHGPQVKRLSLEEWENKLRTLSSSEHSRRERARL